MSISEKLLLLNSDVANARTAITAKGGTVTSGGGSSQLAADIATIPQSGGSSTQILIFSNSGAILTCGSQTYTLGAQESYHAFAVAAGTYTCTSNSAEYGQTNTMTVTISSGIVCVNLPVLKVPSDYQEVEYLQSSGTQYINTGVSPDGTNTGFEITALATSTKAPSTTAIGTITNAGVGYLGFTVGEPNNPKVQYYWGTYNVTSRTMSFNQKFSASLNWKKDMKFIFDNTQLATLSNVTITTNPIYLFKLNLGALVANEQVWLGRIYSCRISNNSSVTHNYIPCYKKSDNTAGMYDTVTNTFLTNAGTGTFSVGADVLPQYINVPYIIINSITGATLTCGSQTYTLQGNETWHAFQVSQGTFACTASKTGLYDATTSVEVTTNVANLVNLYPSVLPSAYQRVDYLQSSGTQYIDTGLTSFSSNWIYEFTVTPTAETMRVAGCFVTFGNFTADSETLGAFFQGTQNKLLLQNGANTRLNYEIVSEQKYTIKVESDGYTINGVKTTITPHSPFTQNVPLYYMNAQDDPQQRKATGKFGQYKITNNQNTVVRNLIPCYRKSDSVAGMYDTVTNTFFVNQGTGSFVVGEDV